MHRTLPILASLLLTAACGGTVVFDDDAGGGSPGAGGSGAGATGAGGSPSITAGPAPEVPAPLALYVADREGCGLEAPVAEAEATMSLDDSGLVALHVVDLAFVDECTGAGGQYILGRTPDGTRAMWLGAHACYFFEPELVGASIRPGVARTRLANAPVETPRGACVSFPGEDGTLTSDLRVEAIAVFATRDDALAFVAAHE